MFMIVMTAIEIAVCLFVLLLVMRVNMHMLQLNGYKNNEHMKWLAKHIGEQWLLFVGIVLGILVLFIRIPIVFDVIFVIWAVLTIAVSLSAIKRNTKKRFVYTARVKRLITVNMLIAVAFPLVFGLVFSDIRLSLGICIIISALQFILPVVVNVINKPMETLVNRYYINDAKKKLKSVPDLTVIGVTGSYGKTSVKFYLQALLSEEYEVLVTPESYNTPMGVVKTIRGSLMPTHQIFVCEMGARYVGDIKELCDIVHPAHGVITAVGPQHLETFGDIDHVRSTKFELAEALPKDGKLFLNADNDQILSELDKYEDRAVLYHTCEMNVGYLAKDIKVSSSGTEFTVETDKGESERFSMQLVGEHNVINVLGAIAVANSFGIALSRLRVPVRRLTPIKHRMELIPRGNVTIIDDAYNSNPVGSKAAVETLAQFDGLKILVTPGMVELGDKEEEYNRKFGGYAAECCDHVLLVGKKRTKPIMEGALEAGLAPERCVAFDDLNSALTYAHGLPCDGHKYILLENDLPDNY